MDDYTLLCSKYLEEKQTLLKLYMHNKTKAYVCTLSNDDKNKVFNIAFKTIPKDNTGVFHILEHSVLCGSRKYQVKDPFIALAKSSVNNFLNAMTFTDKTCFPLASVNLKDFKNLCDVYLDAVFYPNIYKYKEIFAQEAYHYEIKDGNVFPNGIVFNEMKDAYADAKQKLNHIILKTLYPNTSYAFEAGGLPEEIIDLKYEDFLKTHQKFYHPSNAIIYFYGDCDMEERLSYLALNYLNNFSYQPLGIELKKQEAFLTEQRCQKTYYIASDNLENKAYLSYNIVIKDKRNVMLNLALTLLLNYLFNGSGAPIREKLINLGLCKDINATIINNFLEITITIVALEANEAFEDKFINTIDESLKQIIDEGLDKNLLETLLARYEFKIREDLFYSTPKGLNMIFNSLNTLLYDKSDPYSELEVLKYLGFLRETLNTNYFTDVLKNYILDNKQKAYVSLIPTNIKEESLLDKKVALYALECDINLLKAEQANLIKYQNTIDTKEGIASLPKLNLSDINTNLDDYSILKNDTLKAYPFYHTDYDTSGIIYFDYLFSLKNFTIEDLNYISLLSVLFKNLDTKKYKVLELKKRIFSLTGALSFDLDSYIKKDNTANFYFKVSISSLSYNLAKISPLLSEIIFNTQFDSKLLEQKINNLYVVMKEALEEGQVGVLITRALSQLDLNYFLDDNIYGLSFYYFVEYLVKNFKEKYNEIIKNLERIRDLLFVKSRFSLRINAKGKYLDSILKASDAFYASLLDNTYKAEINCILKKQNEAYIINSNVNMVLLASFIKEKYSGAFDVVTNILNADYLWQNLRVLGGAYGAGCYISLEGSLVFFSYADPNLLTSITCFKEASNYLKELNLTDEELKAYKIRALTLLNMVKHIKYKGEQAFAFSQKEIGEDLIKRYQEIKDCTIKDIKRAALALADALDRAVILVLGAKKDILENKNLFNEIKQLGK